VNVSPEVAVFVEEYDFTLSPEAEALLAHPPAPPAPQPNVWLEGQRVIIESPYNPQLVDAVRALPGRSWDGVRKVNTANVHPDVLPFAQRFNLVVHPDVVKAIEAARGALEAQHAADLAAADVATVMGVVSRTGAPEALPEVFIDLLRNALGDVAEDVLDQ
jgi:hypothetical protein